ncbi:hypothetical protein DB30_05566 [Enhygromyxa salina]|uniref:Uncharacterized protein n=1 Tax=Enhygromyxa salina TaxID=215803 RepID=A0A0C1ZCL8_9BACT|nr:hypothetical protein [Enhygromyxa salina]KIG15449.1 hypothetical protein DB30_05566 [Enhygromyxa salina]
MAARSPMLRALSSAQPDVPEQLLAFDEQVRAGAAAPSFEEYSARLGAGASVWRQTCYFDVASDPRLIPVANDRFERIAGALGVPIPGPMLKLLRSGGVAGPEVLQIVLGIDAGSERPRLKYYLIFRDDSASCVERLRAALDVPALPSALRPGSVYILGLDFTPERLTDFKIYVRLDPRRVPAVIRNLAAFEALWRGSRYLVFQRCLLSGGRQVYFHGSSSAVLETWLRGWAARDPAVQRFCAQVEVMNEALRGQGVAPLRPWIASLPHANGQLLPSPANVYFHFTHEG